MKEEQQRFLMLLGQLPARLTAEQAGWVLNCQSHDVPTLVTARLLKPLGNPPPNGIKFFATADLIELTKDRSWLVRVTTANRRETCDCLSSLKRGLFLTKTVMSTDSTSQGDTTEQPTSASQGRSNAGLGRTVLRLLVWTVVGTLAGFCFMPLTSFFERYNAISSILSILMLPAQGMFAAWVSLGFGPHGEAGFIMLFVFIVVEWALAGFLFGVGRTWYLRRKGRDEMTTTRTPKRKQLLYAAALLVLVVGGYCAWQEVLIAKDRTFFLSQVNYKEFAEASLDLLVNPDRYGLSLGNCKGTDPKLPEAIRKLKTADLVYHGYTVRVCNFYFQGLAFSHSMKEPTRYEVVFERNYRDPVILYSLQSTNLPKIDWH